MSDEWDECDGGTVQQTKTFGSARGVDNGWAGSERRNDTGWTNETPKKENGGWDTNNNAEWGKSSNDTNSGEKNERGFRPRLPNWICNGCQEPKGDSKDAPPDSGSRSNRPNDWICDGCGAKVFGSKDTCFKCQEPKGDSKDAPPDSGNRSNRPNDWICDGCGAKVFGSKDTCFKCQEPKGDSKDAPPDSGNRSNRPNDWICEGCGAKVFGSKDTCFKCQSPKGDSKDAPEVGGFNNASANDNEKKEEWECACGNTNFANRDKCRKCFEPKPRKEGDPEPKEYYCPTELKEDELFNTGITAGINFEKYDKIPVEVIDAKRNNAPRAIETFESSGLNSLLLQNLSKSGYKTPTPIQKNAIPIILGNRDLMACAQTGSGKTAAFLLPIINSLMRDQVDLKPGQPYALIVTPTRELTIQIYDQSRKYSQGGIIRNARVYGGTSTRYQSENLDGHILVATPGRLLDFVEKGKIGFENIRYLVLDEADRMLDMGFKDAIEKVMNSSQSGERQTLMFSATFPKDIRVLAEKYLRDSIFLKIGLVGGACTDVTQTFFEVGKVFSKKLDKLMELLNAEDSRGTVVFVETKSAADRLAVFLSESEHPTTSIHGDRKQSQREDALKDFKTGKMKVLIATSVCARGIDIPNVRNVINFDLPKDIDDYVHRIGRTGRVGNAGKATSFFCAEQNGEIVNDLVRILTEAGQPIPDFLGGGGAGQSGGSDFRSSTAAADTVDDDNW